MGKLSIRTARKAHQGMCRRLRPCSDAFKCSLGARAYRTCMFEILSTIAHLHSPTARVALRAPGEMESLGFPAHCTYYTRDVARFGLYRDV